MKTSKSVTNVWPGYVAAVSSLVLSLLLLAGVLVVSISQASQILEAYNRKLVNAVIQDELRQIELEKLRQLTPEPMAKSTSSRIENESQKWKQLLGTLQDKSAEFAKAQDEWLRLRAAPSPTNASAKEPETYKLYRLIFASGAEEMDGAMVAQLRQQLLRDGDINKNNQWFLESATKGLDAVAERETYRLRLKVRSQLQALGASADQIKVIVNRERTPQELLPTPLGTQRGEMALLLRREFQRTGT